MIKKIVDFIIEKYTLIFLFLTAICSIFVIIVYGLGWKEALIRNFLFWNVGIRGLIAFFSNWYSPIAREIARAYGWPLENSFQTDLAATEGAFGILGILSLWFKGDFWFATLLGMCLCMFFSELGSLSRVSKRMRKEKNYALSTSLHLGMRIDLFISLLMISVLVMWKISG